MVASEITSLQFGGDNEWPYSATQLLLAPFRMARQIWCNGEPPPQVALVHMRNYLRLMGLWPSQGGVESRWYMSCNLLIMLLLAIFLVTITCELHESSHDIVMFGDDLVVLLGAFLIYLKIWLFRNSIDEIECIIAEFNALHRECGQLKVNTWKVHRLQRLFFFGECMSLTGYLVLGFSLFAAITMQPFFINQAYPIRAKFPLGLHQPDRHPHFCIAIYVFQSLVVFYNIYAVIFADSVGCYSFGQTALNLRILCIRLRGLGANGGDTNIWQDFCTIVRLHQRIIRLIDRINTCFYWNYVAQMGASTFIICLTAFEALLAKDQPLVAIKFQVYMFAALMQLLYWCLMGNMAYFDSLEVATAAFEGRRWLEQSPQFQRDLMFLIQRAQNPLTFRAKPFYSFNFQSFTSILSTSYSYFALLRTLND